MDASPSDRIERRGVEDPHGEEVEIWRYDDERQGRRHAEVGESLDADQQAA
jgi:hypothetical protein